MNKTTAKRIQALLPNGIPKYIRAYDNGGETADRYTVVYTGNYRKPLGKELRQSGHYGQKEWFQHVSMSDSPFHPQGIGMHGEHPTQIDVNAYGFAPAMGRKNHLGKRIPFSELPPDCKQLVMQDYREIWSLPSPLEVLAFKLHPERFTGMSPKMASIVGYIIGQVWVFPQMNGLFSTSDGFVLASFIGDNGANQFIGSKNDLVKNWFNLLNASDDLAFDERQLAEKLFAERVTQF